MSRKANRLRRCPSAYGRSQAESRRGSEQHQWRPGIPPCDGASCEKVGGIDKIADPGG